ncbi:hypothetical protein SAMN04487843_1463 [Methylobacterium sp. ap11]|nr:hypothetical protein SAMN04487843_1463 [Methylobacterium sp. ap11]
MNYPLNNVYCIKSFDYRDRQSFAKAFIERHGLSFEKTCDHLSDLGPSCLIIDDIATHSNFDRGHASVEQTIAEIVEIALQYCEELVIILRSRKIPSNTNFGACTLKEFDEADLLGYVRSFGDKFADVCSEQGIRTLHRHTDGLPIRVDTALSELEVVPLSELVNTNTDLMADYDPVYLSSDTNSLSKTIDFFAKSDDLAMTKAYELLKSLAVFPKGEQLVRVRRFILNKLFSNQQALLLLRYGLIENTTVQLVDVKVGSEAARTLLVPRLVRERIREIITDDEFNKLNRRAAEIYFGSEWFNGIFKPSAQYRFDNAHCGIADIINANAIIFRLVREMIEDSDQRNLSSVVNLASVYCRALMRGDHYSGAVALLEDIMQILPQTEMSSKISQINVLYAEGLRMIGDHSRSIDIINGIDFDHLNKDTKQNALLCLAFSYDKLDMKKEVMEKCAELIAIDSKRPRAWHAKSVLLRLQEPSPERTRRLRSLERHCRRHGAIVVANEIALRRAEMDDLSVEDVISILSPVLASTSDQENFYIRLRALVKIINVSLDEHGEMNIIELQSIIMVYQYLFNEQMGDLFDRCHEMLWRHFAKNLDYENLLRLFRHSSINWRLRGKISRETSYIDKGQDLMGNISFTSYGRSIKDMGYFKMRAETLGRPGPKALPQPFDDSKN